MQTQPASNRIYSLVVLYDMHSQFLLSALDGISDDDAHTRLGTKANHVAWLTGSIIEDRFEIAKILGIEKQQAAHDLFKDNKGIQDDVTYPSLSDFKKDWEMISPLVKERLFTVSDEKLDESFEMMPNMKMTYFELITFIIYREANIIGQIALWRRLLGYDAMKYM
jgi:hypothetical protein